MLFLIVIATLVAATNAQYCWGMPDYCSICANHTMCLYPASDYAVTCSSPVYAGLICNMEKQLILDVMNSDRRTVAKGLETRGNPGPQPPAANMRKLVWDDELARIAQRWTNQCNFTSPPCSDVERFKVAENHILTVNDSHPTNLWAWWDYIFQGHWYMSVVEFDSNNVSPYMPGPGDQYAKMVWANSYTIGCGFTGSYGSGGDYNQFYVCLYGPGGYTGGDNSSVYQIGPACSACPAGTICEDGLCA